MKNLTIEKFEVIQGGDFCSAAGALAAGYTLGTAGMLYFGVATVLTGGTATAIAAVAMFAAAAYCHPK